MDVTAYNSKNYYILGDVLIPGKLPITGNETVLDAIEFAGGLMPTAAPQNIRLVRPAPPGACCEQVLPVNLAAITSGGDPTTNYQIMPSDRIIVYRDPIVRLTVFIDRLAAPFQTVVGSTLQYSFAARYLAILKTPLPAAAAHRGGRSPICPWSRVPDRLIAGIDRRDVWLDDWLESPSGRFPLTRSGGSRPDFSSTGFKQLATWLLSPGSNACQSWI